jgi:asparagine synthase (glutamine-hydrolysing)
MCGITGYTIFNKVSEKSYILDMVTSLDRRGPDSNDYVLLEDYGNTYALGHTRLSIIDVSELGNQPMENEKYFLVLNGEVYNYEAIRKDLIHKGVRFTSHTDSEVVLEAITYFGIDKALSLFKGMWAFSLYDKNSGETLLCRDRIGVKPLYYYFKDNTLLYGSELKSIMAYPKFKKEIDKKSLSYFLKYGYINAPNSIFKNTFKVLPGEYILFDKFGEQVSKTYWSVEATYEENKHLKAQNLEKGIDDSLKRLNDVLCESFNLRMVSDVPVGVFLSGGVDSSLLVSLLRNELNYDIDTFTVGFDVKEYDESNWAKIASKHLKTNHNELICTEKDALELIYQLPKVYDEPFGDSSAIPTMLVSRFARQKVKVGLSADGGDELFFGYNRYKTIDKLNKAVYKNILSKTLNILPNRLPENLYGLIKNFKTIPGFKDKITKFKNVINSKDLHSMYDASLSYFTNDELSLLLGEKMFDKSSVNINYDHIEDLTFVTDLKNYLPGDILAKVDRASMAYSLEARDPFLDHSIIKFSAETPLQFKYKDGEKKYILKKLLEKHLPKDYVYREKKGFGIPIDKWFNGELKPIVNHYLSEVKLKQHNLFNISYVQFLLKNYYANKGVNSHKIWFLLMFQMWFDEWITNA